MRIFGFLGKLQICTFKGIRKTILLIKSLKYHYKVNDIITIKEHIDPINDISPNKITVIFNPNIIKNKALYAACNTEPSEESYFIAVDRLFLGLSKDEQNGILFHEIGHLIYHYSKPDNTEEMDFNKRMELIKEDKLSEDEQFADLYALDVLGPDYINTLYKVGNMSVYKFSKTNYMQLNDYECLLRIEHLLNYVEEVYNTPTKN